MHSGNLSSSQQYYFCNKNNYRFAKMEHKQKRHSNKQNLFFTCADLVLPWLNPNELASVSLTCKFLNTISKSITIRRSSDASRTFENFPIPFINNTNDTNNNHPYSYFIYTPSLIINSIVIQQQRQCWGGANVRVRQSENGPGFTSFALEPGGAVVGCDCERCGVEECVCCGLRTGEMMSECGVRCGCGVKCGNRVTQGGVSVRVNIVRDGRKGWGLYASEIIRAGQFVCEYAGELVTTEEARRRQKTYDELSLGGQFSPALLVVREHLPSGKACLRINIDATRVGNVARFINHSCDGGNLSTILVRNSGDLLPRLCFFASREIQEDEELTFSYGDTRINSKGLPCFCGRSGCLGILPSEQT